MTLLRLALHVRCLALHVIDFYDYDVKNEGLDKKKEQLWSKNYVWLDG